MKAISANDALVNASGALSTLASSLFTTAQDIHFGGSGARCASGELLLPVNEPRSSCMAGKVKPTQCESMTMVCAKVMGNYPSVTIGLISVPLQLKTFKPLLISSFLHSLRIKSEGIDSFRKNMLIGLAADVEHISDLLTRRLVRIAMYTSVYSLILVSLMLVTCLSLVIV